MVRLLLKRGAAMTPRRDLSLLILLRLFKRHSAKVIYALMEVGWHDGSEELRVAKCKARKDHRQMLSG